MKDQLKIYIDRLRDEKCEQISLLLPSEFMEISDRELIFSSPIEIEGEAYTADDFLILRLKAKTTFSLPCSICNEMITLPLELNNFYHTESLETIKGALFDFGEILRDTLLLDIPAFAECQSECPERKSVNKFFKKEEPLSQEHFPFESL